MFFKFLKHFAKNVINGVKEFIKFIFSTFFAVILGVVVAYSLIVMTLNFVLEKLFGPLGAVLVVLGAILLFAIIAEFNRFKKKEKEKEADDV